MKRNALLLLAGALLLLSYRPSLDPPVYSSGPLVQNEESPGRNLPDSAYENVEKKVKELIEELEKLQKDAGKKLRKDIVPRLEQELEKLKEWLRDFRTNEKGQPGVRET